MVIGKCTDVFKGILLVGGRVEKSGICWRNFPSRNLSGKKISMKGAQDFLVSLKKNNGKIDMKKFFQLEVRSSIKT